jgi:cellulose synthase/poly-beta-1,6-N-acetylglucosamine synthase-like glycosyltransferase
MAVLVPAHNEERLIARTVRSLLSAAGPHGVRLFVVADNCSDSTAAEAEAAGAIVLERSDRDRRGKSFALDFGLAHLRALSEPPVAVAIVDADTEVSENFFAASAARLAKGARAVQVHYAAAGGSSDVARLRRLAFSLVHWARPLGASRLSLPTTLKGNGMVFAWDVIHDGFPGSGITEDADATLALARRGITVAFEPRATALGLMAQTYAEAATQDERWEGGRIMLLPRAIPGAVIFVFRGRLRAAAAALELASPPLTMVAVVSILGVGLALAGAGSLRLGAAGAVSIVAYVGLGLLAARPSRGDLLSLIHAPRFVMHKVFSFSSLLRGRPREWQRTSR